MGFIEASSHPRGVWVLLRRVLIQGGVGFIEGNSHPRGCGFY